MGRQRERKSPINAGVVARIPANDISSSSVLTDNANPLVRSTRLRLQMTYQSVDRLQAPFGSRCQSRPSDDQPYRSLRSESFREHLVRGKAAQVNRGTVHGKTVRVSTSTPEVLFDRKMSSARHEARHSRVPWKSRKTPAPPSAETLHSTQSGSIANPPAAHVRLPTLQAARMTDRSHALALGRADRDDRSA